jgi:N-acetylmuramoyl-L-alanine amidase
MVSAPSIRWIGCHARNFDRQRGGIRPEAVVLHIAEGTLAGMDAWFSNPASGVSAHFGVGKDGRVHQYVSVDDTAFANGVVEQGNTARLIRDNPGINPNAWSCSVEHEGFTGETLTPEQWQASTRLTAWLFAAHLLAGGATGVAVDRDHILRHADITPRSRARCPGWLEPYHEGYIAQVQQLLAPEPDRTRELLDALTTQAAALDEAAQRAEHDALRFRVQAANLREIVDRFQG